MSNGKNLNAQMIPLAPFYNLIPLESDDDRRQNDLIRVGDNTLPLLSMFNRSPLFDDDEEVNLQFNGVPKQREKCIQQESLSLGIISTDTASVPYTPVTSQNLFSDIENEYNRFKKNEYTPHRMNKKYGHGEMHKVVYVDDDYIRESREETRYGEDASASVQLARAAHISKMSVGGFISHVYQWALNLTHCRDKNELQSLGLSTIAQDVQDRDSRMESWSLFLYVGGGHIKRLHKDFLICDIPPCMMEDLIMTTGRKNHALDLFNHGVVLYGLIRRGDINLIQHRLWWKIVYDRLDNRMETETSKVLTQDTVNALLKIYHQQIEIFDGTNGGIEYEPKLQDIFTEFETLKFGIGAIELGVNGGCPDLQYCVEEYLSLRSYDGLGDRDDHLTYARPHGFPLSMQWASPAPIEHDNCHKTHSFWFMPENKRCIGAVRERFEESKFTVKMLIANIEKYSSVVCKRPAILLYIGGSLYAQLHEDLELLEIFHFMLRGMIIVEDIDATRARFGTRLIDHVICPGERLYFNHRLWWYNIHRMVDKMHGVGVSDADYNLEIQKIMNIISSHKPNMKNTHNVHASHDAHEKIRRDTVSASLCQQNIDNARRMVLDHVNERHVANAGHAIADPVQGRAAYNDIQNFSYDR